MDPRKPSQLLPFLQERGLLPKKSLSQNFLIDENIFAKIMEEAAISAGETILEIGSGPGGLTKTLLEKGCKVIAIEKDQRFAALLPEILPSKDLTVIHQDFLTYSIDGPVKVVANIPYNITTPILEHLTQFSHNCSRITLVVQKDLAERIMTPPPSRNAGFLAHYLHFHFTFSKGYTISPRCFWPIPKVSSFLFSLIPKKELPTVDKKAFFSFLAPLFHHKRKMVCSLLKDSRVENCLVTMGLSPRARPEELSLTQFLTIYFALCNK